MGGEERDKLPQSVDWIYQYLTIIALTSEIKRRNALQNTDKYNLRIIPNEGQHQSLTPILCPLIIHMLSHGTRCSIYACTMANDNNRHYYS